MNWNYRIMRRYPPESPENYFYDIVEVIYGEDGRPMMWNETTLPQVNNLDLDLENDDPEFDEEYFVKESLKVQFATMAQDIDGRAPIMDERDFEAGGIYADHPDLDQYTVIIKALDENDQETLEELGVVDIDMDDIHKSFSPDDEDEEDDTTK